MKLYIRHYVSANQLDWAKLIGVAQFYHNLQRSKSTIRSPFEIVLGLQPMTLSMVTIGYKGVSPFTYNFIIEWNQQADVACICLGKTHLRGWRKELKRRGG